MTHHSAEHTCDVAGSEGDHQLLGLVQLTAGNWDHVLVEELHRPLKGSELHHGVWYLPHPQRRETLVETDEGEKGRMMGRWGRRGG